VKQKKEKGGAVPEPSFPRVSFFAFTHLPVQLKPKKQAHTHEHDGIIAFIISQTLVPSAVAASRLVSHYQ